MKWFKHISDSLDDPLIYDLLVEFGSDGYLVFFGILEKYSREFSPENGWNLVINPSYFHQKFLVSSKKIEKILSKIHTWDIKFKDNKVIIFIPKFTELLDEWSRRKLGSSSGVTPKNLNTDKDKDTDKDKRIKKEADASLTPKISKQEKTPKTKYLDSVFLTDEQYKKLQEAMSQKSLDGAIEKLDYSITVKGGKYRDHYKAILNWQRRGFLDASTGKQDLRPQQSKRFISPRDSINADAAADADEIARRYTEKIKQASANGNT